MIQVLKHLFFPPKCIVCGRLFEPFMKTKQWICDTCEKGVLHEPQSLYCENLFPDECVMVYGLFPYVDQYKRSVLQWKYKGIRKYVKGYSQLMGMQHIDWEEIGALIPVPLSKSRMEERGFNQAYDLAVALGKEKDIPIFDVLYRHKKTKPQSQCTKKERFHNIKDSMNLTNEAAKKEIQKLEVIALIDDIYTTGSTIRECLKTLQHKGGGRFKKVYVLVVARGM